MVSVSQRSFSLTRPGPVRIYYSCARVCTGAVGRLEYGPNNTQAAHFGHFLFLFLLRMNEYYGSFHHSDRSAAKQVQGVWMSRISLFLTLYISDIYLPIIYPSALLSKL